MVCIVYYCIVPYRTQSYCTTFLHGEILTPSIIGQNPDADELEEMIDEADADGSGSINFPEFIELMLKKQQGGQTKDEIKQVRAVFSTKTENAWSRSKKSQFIVMVIQLVFLFIHFFQAFRVFDKDGNGYVSSSEIKFVMSGLGVHFTDDELQEMVQEADIDGDGQVCFEEFYNMMTAG